MLSYKDAEAEMFQLIDSLASCGPALSGDDLYQVIADTAEELMTLNAGWDSDLPQEELGWVSPDQTPGTAIVGGWCMATGLILYIKGVADALGPVNSQQVRAFLIGVLAHERQHRSAGDTLCYASQEEHDMAECEIVANNIALEAVRAYVASL